MALFTYPNGPQDHDGILRYAKDVAQSNRAFWNAVEIQAWKNILYFIGLQRITYSPAARFWRPLAISASKYPVTNRIKVLINDFASKVVAFKPPVTWGPGSDEESDYIAASVADRVNTVIEREANIRELKPIGARWKATTGNVWLVSSYDTSPENGSEFIGAQRCLHCLTTSMPMDRQATGGMCPACGSQEAVPGASPMMGGQGMMGGMTQAVPRFQPAIDGTGTPIGIQYPRGRHLTELENVFTVRFDPYVDRFHRSPYVRIARTRPQSWVAEQYGEAFAETVKVTGTGDMTTRLLEGLAVTAFGGAGPSSGTGEDRRVLVERLWIRPHPEKAPGGIYAEIVGDQIAVGRDGVPIARDYPYHDERGRPMLNIAHVEFDQVPGRALASTRCDDAVEVQTDLNEYDAFIKAHMRRMANAVWMLPRGSNVSRMSGEEGIYIEYDALATGQRPERASGVSVPQDLLLMRNSRKAEMDEVFGLAEVSRGEPPRGVTAYVALQLLDERAQQGLSNPFDNWALGWMEWSRQNICIAREYWDEPRMLSLGVGKWAARKFTQAQIQGGVDINVDLGMNRPTSLVAKAARIGQAITQGLVNVFDPQQRFLSLRALGIPEIVPDYNKDYERAGRVLDQMMSAQGPQELPPAPYPFDNHSIHLFVFTQFIKDEAFEALEPWKQQAIVMRAMIHYQAMRQDMLQQAAGAGQNAPRIGGGGGAGGGGGKNGKPDYTTEQGVLAQETQGASPDSMTGASAEVAAGG